MKWRKLRSIQLIDRITRNAAILARLAAHYERSQDESESSWSDEHRSQRYEKIRTEQELLLDELRSRVL